MNSGPVPSPTVIRNRGGRFGKGGHGRLHLQRRQARAQLVALAAEKDEQRVAAKFEQIATIAVRHLQQGRKETIDNRRDLFSAFFTESRQLFRHGRKARNVGKHHGAVYETAFDPASLWRCQQRSDNLTREIRRDRSQQCRQVARAQARLPDLVAVETLTLERRGQIAAQGFGQFGLGQKVAVLRHCHFHQ
jgi:hypothetical protein